MQKKIAVLVFIATIILEVILLKQQLQECMLWIIVLLLAIPQLLFILFARRKNSHFIQTFIVSLRGGAGTFLGIIALLFLLVHIGWLADTLRDYYSHSKNYDLVLFFVHFSVLPIPFLVESILIKVEKPNVGNDSRKVLITGISLLDGGRKATGTLSEREKASLEQIGEVESWENWSSDYANRIAWKPIMQSIQFFPNLERVILISSRETEWLREAIAASAFKTNDIVEQIKKYFPKLTIDVIQITDPQSIGKTYKEVNIHALLNTKGKPKFQDKELIFGITGSTATTSSALTMLAIKGNRGIVYVRQDNNSVETHDVDVYTVSELWDEMVEKIGLN